MTQSDMTSEPQTTPLGALKEWAEKHLSEMPTEPDAEDVLEFEQGDDVAWPEEKLFGQVLTGGFCLCSGDDIVVELHPGDFFPTLTPDSKFRLLANGEPSSKCRWFDQEALGEVTAELTQTRTRVLARHLGIARDRDQSTANSGERS